MRNEQEIKDRINFLKTQVERHKEKYNGRITSSDYTLRLYTIDALEWVLEIQKVNVVDEKKLIGNMDARVWAEEFVRLINSSSGIDIDEGLMIGWFANAIMTGHDSGKKEKVTETLPSRDKYYIFVCPNCQRQLHENDMGFRCPNCEEWQYDCTARRVAVVREEKL